MPIAIYPKIITLKLITPLERLANLNELVASLPKVNLTSKSINQSITYDIIQLPQQKKLPDAFSCPYHWIFRIKQFSIPRHTSL